MLRVYFKKYICLGYLELFEGIFREKNWEFPESKTATHVSLVVMK